MSQRYIYVLFYCLLFLVGTLTHSIGQTCTVPSFGTINYPNGPVFHYSCNPSPCQDTLYLEYGPPGFTPGTNLSPGPGGTVVQLPFGGSYNYFPPGLPLSSYYDAYVRQDCGTSWSANAGPKGFSTLPDCNASSNIVVCESLYTLPGDSGTGALNNICGVSYSSKGREKVYRFTSSHSGMHQLFIQKSPSGTNPSIFFFKEVSLGCSQGSQNSWTCIGTGSTFQTSQHLFGPLVAGVEYYLRGDFQNENQTTVDVNFKIECPICPEPAGITTRFSPLVADIFWSGSNSGKVEIGPIDFIPGTGTNFNFGSSNYSGFTTVYGLSPSTHYYAYVRNACGSPGGLNSQRIHIYTPSCPIEPYTVMGQSHYIPSDGPGYNWSGVTGIYPLGYLEGTERIIRFTSPVSGLLDMSVNFNPNYSYGLGMKLSNPNCTLGGYICPQPSSSTGSNNKYRLGPFLKDTIYDFFIDISDTSLFMVGGLTFSIFCPVPDTIIVNYLQPTEVEVSWTSIYDSVFIEYGPPSFTPGTGNSPGAGGTLLSTTSNSIILSNLIANTNYDLYLRSQCGGSFSPNSPKKLVMMQSTCNSSPVITCNSTFGIFWPNSLDGVWNNYTCLSQNYDGREKVFQFVAQDSGMHHIYITQEGWYCWNTGIFYRDATSGCADTGWVCIGNNSCPPELFTFGPLEAGKTYYLMLDSPDLISGGVNKRLYLYCPAPCLQPFTATNGANTDTSVSFNITFMDIPGEVIIEYGLTGFIPGTDTIPGPGGTIVTFLSPPYLITGLTPATHYDFYIRQKCTSGVGFSPNFPRSYNTIASNCAVGPTHIHSHSGDTLCAGEQTYLSAQGVIPSMQNGAPEIIWYLDSCFSTPIDTANFITISPQTTTTYFAIAFDSCGFTSCVSKTLYVLQNPVVNIIANDTLICSGDSTMLNAGPGFISYLWNNGSTSQSIYANQQGNYIVTITDVIGCTASDNLQISELIPPIVDLSASGPTTFCQGDSVMLTATAGLSFYQWLRNNIPVTGVNASQLFASSVGLYKCAATDSLGCIGISPAIKIIIPCIPIGPNQEKSITDASNNELTVIVSPNPSFGGFNFEVNCANEEIISIKIFDGQARMVNTKYEQISRYEYHLEKLSPGVYYAQVLCSNKQRVVKIVQL